jgi:hypothetical protein
MSWVVLWVKFSLNCRNVKKKSSCLVDYDLTEFMDPGSGSKLTHYRTWSGTPTQQKRATCRWPWDAAPVT